MVSCGEEALLSKQEKAVEELASANVSTDLNELNSCQLTDERMT